MSESKTPWKKLQNDEIESEYLTIERQGMTDEGYWAAVNGTEFDKGVLER